MASSRTPCQYGENCYRKNPAHFLEFTHPEGNDKRLINHSKIKSQIKRDSGEFELDHREYPKKVKDSPSNSYAKPLDEGIGFSDRSPTPEFELNYSTSPGSSISPNLNTSTTSTETKSTLTLPSSYQDSNSHTFIFTTVDGIDDEYNEYPKAVSLKHILSSDFGDLNALILFSYMVDMDWILEQLPRLKRSIPILMVVQFDSLSQLQDIRIRFSRFPNIKFLRPHLPIPFGTHHSKMLLLFYADGMRVVVTTANFIPVDWAMKTQGVWISPYFPLLESKIETSSNFQNDLVEYLQAYQDRMFEFSIEKILKHEMTNVSIRLVASVPGYHKGEHKYKWGHMKMRGILEKMASSMAHVTTDWPFIGQCSSIGSLGKSPEMWFESEWKSSFTSASPKTPLSMVFPTVENVRTSLEGYSAGKSIPYCSKTCKNQLYLTRYFHQWKSERNGRSRASPHIKSYLRCSPDFSSLAWLLLTSANLSKAAWGSLQKNDTQLMVRSYEIGVLFLPQDQMPPRDVYPVSEPKDDISLYYDRKNRIQLPFDLPLMEYSTCDEPWIIDFSYSNPDVHGKKHGTRY